RFVIKDSRHGNMTKPTEHTEGTESMPQHEEAFSRRHPCIPCGPWALQQSLRLELVEQVAEFRILVQPGEIGIVFHPVVILITEFDRLTQRAERVGVAVDQ